MKLKSPRVFYVLMFIVLCVNVIQSYFTELINDESYYWYYAQNLSWGYFDHPPMVALLIKISGFFFDGELGVRFMSNILGCVATYLLWLLIDVKDKNKHVYLFFVLVISAVLLNAYNFLTLPDTPLLFFATLFLWCYKKYLKAPTLVNALVLGLTLAAMMYSKYHGILVIGFVFISNLKLLKTRNFWIAVFFGIFCYLPHLIWLYQNDFVTIRYHLVERSPGAYTIDNTIGFFVNLPAIFGFVFPFVYFSLFKTKPKDAFTKALLYLVYGVLAFFFIASFSKEIQTQWIVVISIPLIIITYTYCIKNAVVRKWVFRLGIINIVIMCYLRVALIYFPISPIVYETHGNKKWVSEIAAEAGSLPVIFNNAYENAAMYAFYSGNDSYSLNNIESRRNQYNIDDSEEVVQGKKVVHVKRKWMNKLDSYFSYTTTFESLTYYGFITNNFESFRRLKAILELSELKKNTSDTIHFTLKNPYDRVVDLEKLQFFGAFFNIDKGFTCKEAFKTLTTVAGKQLLPGEEIELSFLLPKIEIDNVSYFRISITNNDLQPGLQGNMVPMVD